MEFANQYPESEACETYLLEHAGVFRLFETAITYQMDVDHPGNGCPMAMDKLAQKVIRPAIEAVGLPWYGWHGFRRAVASNLFAPGADDKIVQRVLRHAKPHVTRERYIKVFESALLAAMQKMQTTLEGLRSGQ